MKKDIKDYLLLFVTAIVFVFVTNSVKAQTINKSSLTTIWSLYGTYPKVKMTSDSTTFIVFKNLQYQHITDLGYIHFDRYENMVQFFNKLKEMGDLPNPKRGESYNMMFGDVIVYRNRNILGVPVYRIIKGRKYFSLDGNNLNQILRKI